MHYAVSMNDGSVVVLQTVGDADPKNCVAKWKNSGNVVSIQPIDPSVIPQDRAFRNSWKLDDGRIDVDMPKAREIWRDKMRKVRTQLMRDLDIEQLRGRDVEAQKQALRDVTDDPAIDAATTPEELKMVWPSILVG